MATTTLILGAGLGKEYGFPDGPQLRQLIIDQLPEHERKLKQILRIGTDLTVDEIASNHPGYSDTLRRAVVRILRERENEDKLFHNNRNTYKLMLRQISRAEDRGDRVNVITFNYDRSLQYLLWSVNSLPGPEHLKTNPQIIKTVHGRLAPLEHEDPNFRNSPKSYHAYGKVSDRFRASAPVFPDAQGNTYDFESAELEDEIFRGSKIAFIGENPSGRPEISRAIHKSDIIVFLGLAYHEANMAILGLDFTIPQPTKLIVGTGLGLDIHDIEHLERLYPSIQSIVPCDAYTFLRTKMDISQPERSAFKLPATDLKI